MTFAGLLLNTLLSCVLCIGDMTCHQHGKNSHVAKPRSSIVRAASLAIALFLGIPGINPIIASWYADDVLTRIGVY